MLKRTWSVCSASFVLMVVGCGGGSASLPNVGPGISAPHAEQILGMAHFEMECPRDEIRLTKVAQYRVGATGCGRRMLYLGTISGWVSSASTAETDALPEH